MKLVTDLHTQCNKAKISFEIILFDDYSKDSYKEENRKLAGLFNVSYLEMSENYGRSKIRNMLAKNARYDKVLFLDCDSKMMYKKFIKNYLEHLSTHQVIYGGRSYPKKAPKSAKKKLHWKYGIKRESPIAKKRNKKPYLSFQSNNFVIDRDLFLSIKFDESLEQYGYEDLVLATQIKNLGTPILHIDNPIKHAGLVNTDTFLQKQMQAIDNLIKLRAHGKVMYPKLYGAYTNLKNRNSLGLFVKCYGFLKGRIDRSLQSEKPNLFYLDLWKLNYLIAMTEED